MKIGSDKMRETKYLLLLFVALIIMMNHLSSWKHGADAAARHALSCPAECFLK
jgi:hypothetical protein